MTGRAATRPSTLRARAWRTQLGRLIALGLLVLVATLTAVAAPRLTTNLSDADLRHTLSTTGSAARDLLAPVQAPTMFDPGESTFGIGGSWKAMPRALAQASATMPPALRQVTSAGRFSGLAPIPQSAADRSTRFRGSGTPGAPLGQESLAVEAYPWLRDDSTLVSGHWPRAGGPTGTLQVVVTSAAAHSLGWRIGESQQIAAASGARAVELVGTIRPRTTGSDYWSLDTTRPRMSIEYDAQGDRFNLATMWVDSSSWPRVAPSLSGSSIISWFPLDIGAFRAADVPAVQAGLARFLSSPTAIADGSGDHSVLRVSSTLSAVLDTFTATAAASSSILAVTTAGPLGAAALALILSLRMLVAGSAPVRRLLRARGARALDQAGGVARDVAIVSAPAAAIGAALGAILVPDASLVAPVVTGVVVAATPAALGFLLVLGGEGLSEQVRAGVARRLWVVEVVLVLLMAAAIVIVPSHGSGPPTIGAVDPLVTATPLLIAAGVCVLMIRVFPLVLRLVGSGPLRRGGAGSFVGVLSAIRERGAATWVVVTALTATTVSVLSLVLISSEQAGSRTSTAATASLTVTTIRSVPLIAGIDTVAALALIVTAAVSASAFVITLVAQSPERRRRAATLRLLGLARAEIGRVTAWGLAPAAVGSVVVGTAAGLVTALLILPAVDPTRSTGGHRVPLVVDWPLVGVVAGAILACALVSALVAVVLDQSRSRFGRTPR